MLFLPFVKEQLSKLSLFNVGKGVINNCQKLILKGEITVFETQNGTLQGHIIILLFLAKVQRFVLFHESCKSTFFSRSIWFFSRQRSEVPIHFFEIYGWNAIKGVTTYSNILMILQKIKQLKTVFCNAWGMCFIIIIILPWNYIVFCIKRALGVEKKMELHVHATFSFGHRTVK